MPFALAVLVGLQCVGEALRQTLHLPLPGPLIGMVLLTMLLVARGSAGAAPERAIPPSLLSAADGLIVNMGLLFVPAGVGIIAELDVLRRGWLPILVGLVVSTVLGLIVTGLVMHHVSRIFGAESRAVPQAAAE
jgi:holin-like protein